MSVNVDDSDGSIRVTRRSSRLASVDSITDTEARTDTPTIAPRNKKLNTISELAGTPVNSLLDSPRRTRKISEEPVAVGSPFRRTTRASSQDKDITASPLPTRASRRSALAESDTDDAPTTPARATKAARNKRQSTLASPKIGQIMEESEEDNEKEKVESVQGDETTLLDSSNDLELRNRSITKSPSVTSPPKSSLNGSLNGSMRSNGTGAMDSSHEEEPEVPMKFFTARKNLQESANPEISFQSNHDSDNKVPSAEKKSKRARKSVPKTTFAGVLDRIAHNESKKRAESESNAQLDTDQQQKNGDKLDAKVHSVNNTPVKGRRSIHEDDQASGDTPRMKEAFEEVAKLRERFVKSETPKSAKKALQVAESTSVRTNTPQSAKKTPKTTETDEVSKLMEDFVDNEKVQTPKSAKKLANGTPVRVNTPKSSGKSQETVNVSPAGAKTPASDREKTPVSAVKVQSTLNGTPKRDKTPKSAKKSVGTPVKSSSATSFGNMTMEITNVQVNETVRDSSPMEIDEMMDVDEDAVDMEVTLNKSGTSRSSQQLSPAKSNGKKEKRPSLSAYIDKASQSSTHLSRKSLPAFSSSEDEMEEETAPNVAKPRAKSWGVSVVRSANEAIDVGAKTGSPVVIKGKDTRVKGYSSDEDEEDDDYQPNSFIDDEAEVGSEESITESEAYIREQEVPDDGESIGSEDSVHNDDLDEEEEECSSFLASDGEESDQYSMDSNEKEIEFEEKSKRKSRIIAPSSSEDDEPAVEKSKKISLSRAVHESSEDEEQAVESPAKPTKSPAKSPKSASKATKSPKSASKKFIAKEQDEQALKEILTPKQSQSARKSLKSPKVPVETEPIEKVEEPKSKKMKRRREESDLDVSVVVKPKRVKINNSMIEQESTDNATGIAELFEEFSGPEQPAKEKKAKKVQQPEAVDLEKVINKCEEYMSGYSAEKKAKMALKREKKAQKLALKQKEAEEASKLAGDGLDSSNNSNKENAIAPRKKNKSKVKKQKLVADLPEVKESMAESVSKEQEKLERKRLRKAEKKLAKQMRENEAKENLENTEVVAEAPVTTKKAKKSPAETAPESEIAPEPIVEKKKKSKKDKIVEAEEPTAFQPLKKKKAKEIIVEEPVSVPEEKKKKKKKKAAVVEEVPTEETVQKGKKRKLDESLSHEESVPLPKKKLNVLMQIENPFQHQPQARSSRSDDKDQLSIPLLSQKLKKVIPQKVEIAKKQKKKVAKGKKSIPEPPKSLPRPVWTAAGVFVEAPVSPFKFQSTTYVPIAQSASCSASLGVVAFEGKKKKTAQQPQPAVDFKTQAMFRNMKSRDGSSKNMRGLVRKQNTF